MSETVTGGKVALLDYKTIASGWSKSAVPKSITDEIRGYIDFGTACGISL
jgi:hypothetical protein